MESLSGRVLGPYEVLDQLGAGGMATIYKAHHAAMDRDVAIKVLPQHLAHDEALRARFRREVRTIARLEHRYILPVYDVGEYDGIIFMVMRYIDGGTLRDLMDNGALPTERAVQLITQVAEALAYAHRQGVIHRDIKPQNILIDREGNALLSDFGIAKILVEETLQLTGDGAMLGTPYYMAPEQVSGQKIDSRADIYALGVVLYETLTGRRPFTADTPLSVALMHMQAQLPPPRQFNATLSPQLESVIMKALEKDPAARYQSADEFVHYLQAAMGHGPSPQTLIAAPPRGDSSGDAPTVMPQPTPYPGPMTPYPGPVTPYPGPVTPDPRPAPSGYGQQPIVSPDRRGLPTWAIIAGGLASLALVALLLLVVLPGGWGDSSVAGIDETATVPASVEPTADSSVEATEDPTEPTDEPEEPTDEPEEPTDEPEEPTDEPEEPEPQVAGTEKWIFQAGSPIHTMPAVSDGLVFVGSDDRRLYAVDSATGEQRWVFETQDSIYSSPTVEDGVLYVGSWDSYLYAIDAASGEERWRYKTGARIWSSPTLADGVVYVGSDDLMLHAVDAESGEQRWTARIEEGVTSTAAVANGRVYIGAASGLYAFDAATGEQLWKHDSGAIRAKPLIVDDMLYIGADDGYLYAIHLHEYEVEEHWRFQTGDRVWSVPAWDDQNIYFGSWDHHVYAVDRFSGEEIWSLETPDKVAASPVLHEGTLYIGGDAGLLYALDATAGEEIWSFSGNGFVGSPVLVDDTIFVATSEGDLYAIE